MILVHDLVYYFKDERVESMVSTDYWSSRFLGTISIIRSIDLAKNLHLGKIMEISMGYSVSLCRRNIVYPLGGSFLAPRSFDVALIVFP